MFENISNFFKKLFKTENKESNSGKEAKEITFGFNAR